jgi:hypothetical protein
VDERNQTNTGIRLVALAILGDNPYEIKMGSVRADPLLTTVFKNPPTKPANNNSIYPQNSSKK